MGVQGEGIWGHEVVRGREKVYGARRRKWLSSWNCSFNKDSPWEEQEFKNFFQSVSSCIGLGSSRMLLNGNQCSGFWMLRILQLWRPKRALLSPGFSADGDGKCELVVGYTDRVVRAFRWEDLSENSDHVCGQLILLKKWLLEGQVRIWEEARNLSPINKVIVILMAWKEICPAVTLCMQGSWCDVLGSH